LHIHETVQPVVGIELVEVLARGLGGEVGSVEAVAVAVVAVLEAGKG
jgi:hypothetical protein